jgi:hypothetical protein
MKPVSKRNIILARYADIEAAHSGSDISSGNDLSEDDSDMSMSMIVGDDSDGSDYDGSVAASM